MHMADALLSPTVGGIMTAASAAAIGYSVKKISGDKLDEKKIPMMGVMGAFVFAAQMINFTIPGTGASGHIGGGVLLAALLGPFPALITLASVLLIQCLFFADGGLLALGCNIFNMGVFACLLAYQFVYKPIVKRGLNKKTITIASVVSVVFGLQVGAFGVVVETFASGVTELPFGTFLLLMQPIHLAIGFTEGLITAGVLCFIHSVRPTLLETFEVSASIEHTLRLPMKKVLIILVVATVFIGGGLSLFASSFPDGLEWSIENIVGTSELERDTAVHGAAGSVVNSTAFMPDYDFAVNSDGSGESEGGMPFGTTTAGIVGSLITLAIVGGIGFAVRAATAKKKV